MKKYQILFAGCVRQKGDEVRKLGTEEEKASARSWVNYTGQNLREYEFHPVSLLGHIILQSDLMTAEFRRELAID